MKPLVRLIYSPSGEPALVSEERSRGCDLSLGKVEATDEAEEKILPGEWVRGKGGKKQGVEQRCSL